MNLWAACRHEIASSLSGVVYCIEGNGYESLCIPWLISPYKYNLQQQFGKPTYLMLRLMDNNSESAWGKQNFAYSVNKCMAERHPEVGIQGLLSA